MDSIPRSCRTEVPFPRGLPAGHLKLPATWPLHLQAGPGEPRLRRGLSRSEPRTSVSDPGAALISLFRNPKVTEQGPQLHLPRSPLRVMSQERCLFHSQPQPQGGSLGHPQICPRKVGDLSRSNTHAWQSGGHQPRRPSPGESAHQGGSPEPRDRPGGTRMRKPRVRAWSGACRAKEEASGGCPAAEGGTQGLSAHARLQTGANGRPWRGLGRTEQGGTPSSEALCEDPPWLRAR